VIQINIGDHVSAELANGYMAFPGSKHADIKWARDRAVAICGGTPSANAYFRTLPGNRSLTLLLGDRSIWINYSATMPHFGEAIVGGKELCISAAAFRISKWTVLATLIHELAHINGAPGGASRQAEAALIHCGLGRASEHTSNVDDPKTPYNPGISG
jgi:hypothetical protein